MSLAHKIADFACNTAYEDLSKKSIHEVKRRLIDSMVTTAEPRNREIEAMRLKERSVKRFGPKSAIER